MGCFRIYFTLLGKQKFQKTLVMELTSTPRSKEQLKIKILFAKYFKRLVRDFFRFIFYFRCSGRWPEGINLVLKEIG